MNNSTDLYAVIFCIKVKFLCIIDYNSGLPKSVPKPGLNLGSGSKLQALFRRSDNITIHKYDCLLCKRVGDVIQQSFQGHREMNQTSEKLAKIVKNGSEESI